MPRDAPPSCIEVRSCRPRAVVLRPLLGLLGLSGLFLATGGQLLGKAESRDPSVSVAATVAMARLGQSCRPDDIRWVDPPQRRRGFPFGPHRFVAIARRATEPSDVWLGVARLSPEGRWLELSALHNLSDTSAVAETGLTVSGERIAWTVSDGDDVVAVHVVDLKGQQLAASADMTLLERWQTRLTFLQETGQLAGLCRRVYRFTVPRPEVVLAWTDAGLHVESRGRTGILRCDRAEAEALGLVPEPTEIGGPGDLVTWAVDRVRALPWFGSERMQWVKTVAFRAAEHLDSVKRRVVTSDGEKQLNDEAGDFLSKAPGRAPDPETGWPPRPMTPILTPPIQGEGAFRPLDDDPFAIPPRGGPSPFAFSFLRPDGARPESQIFVMLWDPRLLELHTMTGTREPKTATGETGSGTVPRDDAVIGRLAAAFNGGFQATHGEFGMMAQRIVYLPPKPYAATVAEYADGSLGFGTWPNDESIPETLVGFRQNLTPLVADGKINPYARNWWGGVPAGWQDATRTVRTGLCLTSEDFVAYFYGSSIKAEDLANAMVSARCNYGVHLDMNPGHTGFELYRVGRPGTLPPIQRRLDPTWEARGTVSGTSAWEFLGRRLLRTMHLMHFPRYVRTDSRDFFYLTHRHVLPPDASAGPSSADGVKRDAWLTRGHVQHGFPPAIASTRFRFDQARAEIDVAVVVLDGKWLVPCSSNCSELETIAHMGRPSGSAGLGAYYHARRFLVTNATPPEGAVPIAFGRDELHAAKAVAAIGVAHRDWLFYAEVTRGGDRSRNATLLKRLLIDLGCEDRMYLEQSIELSLASTARSSSHHDELTFLRDQTPIAARVFRETAVVPPATWQSLQAKRVRYLRRRSLASETTAAPGDDPTREEPQPGAAPTTDTD
jgi:hypothetical protein